MQYTKPLQVTRGYLDELDAASPTVPVDRRVLAALGPKMLELSRDRAAGAHPYLVTPEHTQVAREALGEGPLLLPEQHVVLETDAARARAVAREGLTVYLQLPNYVNNWRRLGFTEDDFADGGSDRLIDHVVVVGRRGDHRRPRAGPLRRRRRPRVRAGLHRSRAARASPGQNGGHSHQPWWDSHEGDHGHRTVLRRGSPSARVGGDRVRPRVVRRQRRLRTELSWVADTGELYAMAEPSEPVFMDPIGDTRVPELPTELVTVEVLGIIPDRARVDELLAGWEGQMGKPNSLQWVRDRLSSSTGGLTAATKARRASATARSRSDANAKPVGRRARRTPRRTASRTRRACRTARRARPASNGCQPPKFPHTSSIELVPHGDERDRLRPAERELGVGEADAAHRIRVGVDRAAPAAPHPGAR